MQKDLVQKEGSIVMSPLPPTLATENSNEIDPIVSDLCQHAARKVVGDITDVCLLADSPRARVQISVMATVASLGASAAFLARSALASGNIIDENEATLVVLEMIKAQLTGTRP